MSKNQTLNGVFVASVTPLTSTLAPDLEAIPHLLDFFAQRGAHGALILGTTGEGPSFSPSERIAVYEASARIKHTQPNFKLLAGTGTPSLESTIQLNQAAFDLGFDAVVVLPPYYFRSASLDGLYDWFSRVIEASVPKGRQLLGYHIPQVSGVPLSQDLLTRLAAAYPDQFGGIKDSSGDLAHAQTITPALKGYSVLVGSDRLMTAGLEAGATGCITAAADLISPLLRDIFDAYQQGEDTSLLQEKANAVRSVLETLTPFPAAIKGLLAEMHGFPVWPVKPPLVPFSTSQIRSAAGQLADILE